MNQIIEKRYETLRSWRNTRAKREGIRPFRIFSNRVLLEIATVKPTTKEELQKIFGIGPVKTASYAKQVLGKLG